MASLDPSFEYCRQSYDQTFQPSTISQTFEGRVVAEVTSVQLILKRVVGGRRRAELHGFVECRADDGRSLRGQEDLDDLVCRRSVDVPVLVEVDVQQEIKGWARHVQSLPLEAQSRRPAPTRPTGYS